MVVSLSVTIFKYLIVTFTKYLISTNQKNQTNQTFGIWDSSSLKFQLKNPMKKIEVITIRSLLVVI